MRRPHERGFTLIEMVMTVLIIGVLAALAAIGMQRYRPRAGLASTAAQLTAVINAARQNALSTGHPTAVLVFPQFQNPLGGTGRVMIWEDATYSFFNAAAAPNFGAFDPNAPPAPAATTNSEIMETVDLPRGVTFGFGGLAAPRLAAPYAAIAAAACSFCAASGAVVFDSRGRASFYNANGAPLQVAGATLALGSTDVGAYRLVVITPAAGSVRLMNRG